MSHTLGRWMPHSGQLFSWSDGWHDACIPTHVEMLAERDFICSADISQILCTCICTGCVEFRHESYTLKGIFVK